MEVDGFGIIYNGEFYHGDTCDWHEAELHRNVTIQVLKDSNGHVSIAWYRQADTESEYYEEVTDDSQAD